MCRRPPGARAAGAAHGAAHGIGSGSSHWSGSHGTTAHQTYRSHGRSHWGSHWGSHGGSHGRSHGRSRGPTHGASRVPVVEGAFASAFGISPAPGASPIILPSPEDARRPNLNGFEAACLSKGKNNELVIKKELCCWTVRLWLIMANIYYNQFVDKTKIYYGPRFIFSWVFFKFNSCLAVASVRKNLNRTGHRPVHARRRHRIAPSCGIFLSYRDPSTFSGTVIGDTVMI